MPITDNEPQIENSRAQAIFAERQQSLYAQTDRIFSVLLIFEWIASIALSIWISPKTWAGVYSDVHIHVISSLVLGGLIVLPAVFLGVCRSGQTITRYTIAIAQMLVSALLIHLTGGRIESHFHIFGSLAFLSFYRDWRLLIPATLVTATDHILRGIYFPLSVYGTTEIEPWRWVEHAWWVVFEDSILIVMCKAAVREMMKAARSQAQLEEMNAGVEKLVIHRTHQLDEARAWATMQYEIMQALSETRTWHESIDDFMRAITKNFASSYGTTCAEFWISSTDAELRCVAKCVTEKSGTCNFLDPEKHSRLCDLERTFNSARERQPSCLSQHEVLLPIWYHTKFFGVLKFECIEKADWNLKALHSLGTEIGQFFLRKETESERAHLADVVKQSSSAIITVSCDNRIRSWNLGASNTFGYKECEALDQPLHEILFSTNSEILLEFLTSSARNGKRIDNYELRFCDKKGRNLDLVLHAVPRFDDSGEYSGFSLTFHNVTDRKEAERRVSEFHSVISHELRTPLTSIRGALGLIENGIVDQNSSEAVELIGVARSSADRLIRLINEILDLKKIEAGMIELRTEDLDTESLIESCVQSLKGFAEEAGVKLESESTAKQNVHADRDRATQILTNLISNAIKFSPRGASVRVVAAQDLNEDIRFSIIDRGPGIAESDIKKLFEKFQQIDSSDTRSHGGTGLGLSISRALTEQHGGKIGVNSTVGEGSVFWFTLPASKQTEQCSRPFLNSRKFLRPMEPVK